MKTIQLLSNGIGIFVERDEFHPVEGQIRLKINGATKDGKLYQDNVLLTPSENGYYIVRLRRGQNNFVYRKGTTHYTVEPVYFNGHKAVIESVIGTAKHYASAIKDIVRLTEKVESLQTLTDKLNQQINGTKFLFG